MPVLQLRPKSLTILKADMFGLTINSPASFLSTATSMVGSFIFRMHMPLHSLAVSSYELHAGVSFLSRETRRFYDIFGNGTYYPSSYGEDESDDEDDFMENLRPASDVSVDGVLAALAFNVVIFVALVCAYEILRRVVPNVYSARRRHEFLRRTLSNLPDASESLVPLDWVGPVFGVPWNRVRMAGGLDAYMFLRYIRMCLRITLVSAVWGCVILWPVYATGGGGAQSWYHFSMANIGQGTWRIWVPTVFIYFFSTFVFFVMKQEYRHYLELRMDFLGKGEERVHPQHHYSLMVERIPYDLRSDRALFDYFNSLFPGKVHSASVVLNLPDLEALSARRLRVTRRLEKSIAGYYAFGKRPTHIVGRPRLMCCNIESAPLDCPCSRCGNEWNDQTDDEMPRRGERVDSITYYTRDLAKCNKEMLILQGQKTRVAETGNASISASTWLEKVQQVALDAATQIMDASAFDNGFWSPKDHPRTTEGSIPQAEFMRSTRYGSVGHSDSALLGPGSRLSPLETGRIDSNEKEPAEREDAIQQKAASFVGETSWDLSEGNKDIRLIDDDRLHQISQRIHQVETMRSEIQMDAPGHKDKDHGFWRRLAPRLGFDFFVAGFKYVSRNLDTVVENVLGHTMSSTGFVTFLDLSSVTSASSVPLTHKPGVLEVTVAPEPRDIRWQSAHIDRKVAKGRELTANVLLGLGAILWSFPLAAIQAFATADSLASIKGFEWILYIDGGSLRAFINGYFPVVALLGLILLLPLLFEWIAVNYENRKTLSDVQHSILGRYFYYQLANIYITVTAGSLWSSLANIIDHPSNALLILGSTIPTVVGYFISLLVTKLLAGLPMVILRGGALSRMLFLRAFCRKKKLTQRELDEAVYRPEPVLYGWEYPTQLLVIMICFTYACISPIILPVGALYFTVALMVYKKQVLYVYTPTYESGGILFPAACDRTLFGLICGQITFIGYTAIRRGFMQQFFLLPLPFFTVSVMRYFRIHYAEPSKRLSMERAMELDRLADLKAALIGNVSPREGAGTDEMKTAFNENAYRQPVLTEQRMVPLPYRQGEEDEITKAVVHDLDNRYADRYARMAARAARAAESEVAEDSFQEHEIDSDSSQSELV